jgi:hypothetical protein
LRKRAQTYLHAQLPLSILIASAPPPPPEVEQGFVPAVQSEQ